eukprot:7149428-Pyramimonas_sp.AAC.2
MLARIESLPVAANPLLETCVFAMLVRVSFHLLGRTERPSMKSRGGQTHSPHATMCHAPANEH